MGCAVACMTFKTFCTFLEWVMKVRMASPHVTHYLDVFLLAGPGGTSACSEQLQVLQDTAVELGVPLAEETNEGPATWLTFLGIQLGSSRLPPDKLTAMKGLLRETLVKKKMHPQVDSVTLGSPQLCM